MRDREQMILEIEKESFKKRVEVISSLLNMPQLTPIFASVEKQPGVLDLYTGTGAGAQAVYDRLTELGNKPSEITLVDHFLSIPERSSPDPLGFYTRKYSSGIEETERNMESVSRDCKVNVCEADVLNYFKPFVERIFKSKEYSQLPFNLITAFSTEDVLCSPLRTGEMRTLPFMMRTIRALGNIPTIITYGSVYDKWMDQLNSHLITEYDQPAWNLYAKPEGVGHPGWDKWILTNRQLELRRFEIVV